MDPTKYYGLLYIDEVRNRNTNLAGRGDPVDVYLLCACLCAKAFRSAGDSFCLVTNDAAEIKKRLDRLQLGGLPVVNFEFLLQVPQAIPFYSAHFKLDLFRGFGSGEFGKDVGFVDLDTVLLRKLPNCGGALGVYDISDQIRPVYELDKINADMKKISGRLLPDARWYGGEFVTGSPSMFHAVFSYIEMFWANYIQNVGSLGHVGDEMIMSAALNCAQLDGVPLVDYGKNGAVARWWTSRTRHQQPPFDKVNRAALLHLPADKIFLAKHARSSFEGEQFLRRFRPYVRRKCLSRQVLHLFESLLGTPKHFPPVLA
jgi:hypothetical protein